MRGQVRLGHGSGHVWHQRTKRITNGRHTGDRIESTDEKENQLTTSMKTLLGVDVDAPKCLIIEATR